MLQYSLLKKENFNPRRIIRTGAAIIAIRLLFLSHAGVLKSPETNCPVCGSDSPLTDHHVIPLSWGGSNHPTNKYRACRSCHNKIDEKTLKKGQLVTGEDIRNIEPSNDHRVKDVNLFLDRTAYFRTGKKAKKK